MTRRLRRTAILFGVLVVLCVLAWRLHGRELRRTLRTATRVPYAPHWAARDGVRAPGCTHGSPIPHDETFELPDERRFHVFGPRSGSAEPTPAPLLLVFHGIGDDGKHFADWFEMHTQVGEAAFTVYPDADGAWDLHGEKEPAFVEQIVSVMGERHCIDPSRIFAFGFSWGGKLVSHLACRRDTPLRAAGIGDASYHPYGPGSCAPMDVFVTVRTHDDDEKPEWGKDAAKRWAENGRCAAEPVAVPNERGCTTWPGCEGGHRVVLCEDSFFDPSWPKEWNHTVRKESLALAWRFFTRTLP